MDSCIPKEEEEDIQSNNNNNIVLSMLYAEICPKVKRHNARPEGIMHDPKGSALCLLTLEHISAYNMDNTILLYKYCPLQYIIFYSQAREI